jgi:hypothetical protein
MHAFVVTLVACLALSLASAAAETGGARITTDTAEYCRSLSARVAALPNARLEPVRSIAAEGERLCHNGHVRTGVAKLRRALRAAQAPTATP